MALKIVLILLVISVPLLFFLTRENYSAMLNSPKVESHNLNVTKDLSSIKTLPSIDKIFSDNHTWIASLSGENLRTIIATGDIIPARSVNSQILKRQDFTWPYLKTANVIKNADATFINLETPLIDKCPTTEEGMVFCGDSRNVEGLKFAGVDVVSLANNHAGNWGDKGVIETSKLLKDNGIDVTGTVQNNILVKNIRGVKFAFLGYDDITTPQPGVSNFSVEKIIGEIKQARETSDVVIVTFHWGVEYRDQPDERQKLLGHLAIDSGADLVIGNHPHWIQPIEIYKGKLITYAHGNFVFDQMWSQKTREGVVGRYTFFDNQLIDVEYLPVQINDYGQPYFLEGDKKNLIINDMKSQSLKLIGL